MFVLSYQCGHTKPLFTLLLTLFRTIINVSLSLSVDNVSSPVLYLFVPPFKPSRLLCCVFLFLPLNRLVPSAVSFCSSLQAVSSRVLCLLGLPFKPPLLCLLGLPFMPPLLCLLGLLLNPSSLFASPPLIIIPVININDFICASVSPLLGRILANGALENTRLNTVSICDLLLYR